MSAFRTAFLNLLESPTPGDALPAFLESWPGRLPLLDRADSIPAGPAPYHSGSVLRHMARCMNETAGDALAVWMSFSHDAGKLNTPAALWPHHYNHESRGEAIVPIWVERLGLDPEFKDAGVLAAKAHMRAGFYARMKPGKKLTFLEEVGDSPWAEPFWKLVDADSKSRLGDALRAQWRQVERERRNGISRDRLILYVKSLNFSRPF